MYVNPFWLGVCVTIGAEIVVLLMMAIWQAFKR